MRKTLRALSIAGTVAVGLATAGGLPRTGNAEVPESQDPVKIALFDWTSVNVNAKILGGILHRLGYNVDYVTADYLSSLTTGLTTGDIDVITEEWDTTAGDAMKASDATGKTERLGMLGPKAKEEWWYPIYMKEKCPGLPDWHALLEANCAAAFSVADTAPKGRYLAGPVTWADTTRSGSRPSSCPSRSSMPEPMRRCSPSCSPPMSARRPSCCGSIHPIGHRRNTKGNG